MKKFLFAFALLLAVQTSSAQIGSKVDERFELTGIVSALTDGTEYNWGRSHVSAYLTDVKKHFDKYKNAPVVELARVIYQTPAEHYGTIAATTDMLEIKDGKIQLQPRYNIAQIMEKDPRWDENSFTKYLESLNDFYRKSHFHEFYTKHAAVYRTAESQLNDILAQVDTAWFESFFGQPFRIDFQIYTTLIDSSSYEVPDGLLIGTGHDAVGQPTYSPRTPYMVLHKLTNHYTRPLTKTAWPQVKTASEKLYAPIADREARFGFVGAQTVTTYWLTDLFVLMYFREHNINWPNWFSGISMSKGLIWMAPSIAFMDDFYAHRDRYPHIDAYMPRIVAFVNDSAEHIDQISAEMAAKTPRVVSVTPAINSSLNGVDEIVVTFSQPMTESGGWRGPMSRKDENLIDLFRAYNWSDDHRQLRLPLDASKMKPDTTYSVELVFGFYSADYLPLAAENNILSFHTGQ